MKTLIWLTMITSGLKIIKSVLFLSANTYPRSMTYQPWEDVLDLVIGICFVVWMANLLNTIQ